MSSDKRDNFKGTIIKFFLLALLALFFVVGGLKQLFYGNGKLVKTGQASVTAGRSLSDFSLVNK